MASKTNSRNSDQSPKPTRKTKKIAAKAPVEPFDQEQDLTFVSMEAITAAEQAERHRIARILHDDLQQRIFAVQMQMSFVKEAYEKNDLHAFAADFPQLETWLMESIQVIRQLYMDLNPPILHGGGLVETVLLLASQMQDRHGLEVNIKSDGEPNQFDEKVRILVYYAVRELLTNVVKHSGTLKAAVEFEHCGHHLCVTVTDQGKGFNHMEAMNDPKIAHGLSIARQRLSLFGCRLDVKSQIGQGTQAIIEVPYEKMDT